MMEIDTTVVMRARSSLPLLSVIRRVNDVITGGTRKGRPVGEIKQLMTRFMMLLLSKGFQ